MVDNLKSYIKQRERKNQGFNKLVKQEKAKLVSLIKDKKEDGKTVSTEQSSEIVSYDELKEEQKRIADADKELSTEQLRFVSSSLEAAVSHHMPTVEFWYSYPSTHWGNFKYYQMGTLYKSLKNRGYKCSIEYDKNRADSAVVVYVDLKDLYKDI